MTTSSHESPLRLVKPFITDIALHLAPREPGNELLYTVNCWLMERHRDTLFNLADVWAHQYVPALWFGSFNHLELGEFLLLLMGLPWEQPESSQVFWHAASDERYVVSTIANLRESFAHSF